MIMIIVINLNFMYWKRMEGKLKILDKIFIIMLISVFFTNGVIKLLNFDQTINWVESLSYPKEIVYAGIFIELVAPILILINVYKKIAIYSLVLFCILTAILFHTNLSNPMELTQFLKNIGLAAGFYFFGKSEQHNYFR